MNEIIEVNIPELDKIKQSQWLKVLQYTPKQQVEIATLFSKKIWITATRKKLLVREMTIYHINNCIKCWQGKGKAKIQSNYLGSKKKWLEIFTSELVNRN